MEETVPSSSQAPTNGDGIDRPRPPGAEAPIFSLNNIDLFYGGKQALFDINLDIQRHDVISLIGPSGCGKSTLLRCLNRMNDAIPSCRISGRLLFEGRDIHAPGTDVVLLRSRIGMVFQKPNPFPKSIYDNVAYGPRIHGLAGNRSQLDDLVEQSLMRAGLWDEVKDRLKNQALGLSGGQQQRLCIARTIAVQPEVMLMDEPCSALDPIATAKIEDLIEDLRSQFTIVLVTHSMQQAARVSNRTAYCHLGKIIEVGLTRDIFTRPQNPLTEQYITVRVG